MNEISPLKWLLYVMAVAMSLPFMGLTSSAMASPKTLSQTQLAQRVRPSVVTIAGPEEGKPGTTKEGSGFVVGKDLIATNVHVIKGVTSATAKFQDGRKVPILGVVAFDLPHDLAIVYADTGETPVLTIASDSGVQIGDPVAAVGSPRGISGTVTFGYVSNFLTDDNIPVIQTQTPISPGSSGGALVDMSGQVIGIIRAYRPDAENINFAVRSDLLQPLLQAARDGQKAPSYETWDVAEQNLSGPPPTVLPSVKSPLTGLPGTAITIAAFSGPLASTGLKQKDLLNQGVQTLQDAKIPVYAPSSSPGSAPVLVLQVTASESQDQRYGYVVQAFLFENATVSRSTPGVLPGVLNVITWNHTVVGTAASDEVAQQITLGAALCWNAFTSEYAAANPSPNKARP